MLSPKNIKYADTDIVLVQSTSLGIRFQRADWNKTCRYGIPLQYGCTYYQLYGWEVRKNFSTTL